MKQKETIRSLWTPTAGMLSGARRAAMLLVMMLTTMTAWAQDPFLVYEQGGTGDLTISTPGPYNARGEINGDLIIDTEGEVILDVYDLNVQNIQLMNGTLTLNVHSYSEIKAWGMTVTTLNMDGGTISCANIDIQSGTVSGGTINATNDIFAAGSITGGTLTADDEFHAGGSYNQTLCYLTISGGIISAPTINILTETTINVTDPNFSIAADTYQNTWSRVLTISGRSLIDEDGNVYAAGEVVLSAIAGKTLKPAYSVAFDENGGSDVSDLTVPGGSTISDPGSTKTGYTATWKKGEDVYNFTAKVENDLTLTAQWTANTYTVHFDANGGSGTMADMNLTYDGDWATLTAVGFTAPDTYLFGRWNTKADGSGINYDDKDWVRNMTAENGATVTLYAQWAKDIDKWCTATVPNQTKSAYSTVDQRDRTYDYIFNKFEEANNPATYGISVGETVTAGNTPLTLGTDYMFGDVYYSNMTGLNEPENVDDECVVEIRGIGDYAGTLYAPFTIISPSANGTYGGLSWSVADGTLSITGRGAMTAAASTNAYPWYNYCSIITTISIGEGVTSIADNAFGSQPNIYTYNNVAKVTIPSTVTSIGADAFKGCISATDVYCYADPTKLTWSDTGDDFKSGDEKTKCHVADKSAWSSFSSVNVAFEGDLADVSIPYIDADGSTKFCTNFTVLNGTETTLSAGWYVAQGTVNYTGRVTLSGDVNLILTDNAVVNIGTSSGPISADYCILGDINSLTIYSESTEGDKVGQLNAYNSSNTYHAVYVKNYTQYGGKVTIDDTKDDALYFDEGDLTLARGTLTAKAHGEGRCAILLNNGHTATVSGGTLIATATGEYSSDISGNLTMTGGTLNATGQYGIFGDVTLDWTSADDRIKATTYGGTVTIVDGKAFTDLTNTYLGTLTAAEKTAIANVELQPLAGVTLTKDGSGELTASLDPSSEGEVSIPVAVEVDHVEVDRTYENNKASTVYLPFSIAASKVSGGKFHTFTGVNEATTPWTVTYNEVIGDIAANTPYIFLPNGDNGGKIVVNNTEKITVGTGIASTPQTSGDWEFIGTYERIKWTHDTTDPEYTAAREAEIGSVYGFSAVDNGTDHVGDFVKVGNNVFINPMRAYLKKGSASPARAMAPGAQTQQLPDKMKVVIISASGETTEIGTLDTRTGEITLDVWYSLDGRRLSGKPITKGVYINNGKTVVVK